MSKKSKADNGNLATSEAKKSSKEEKPTLKLSNYDAKKNNSHVKNQSEEQPSEESSNETEKASTESIAQANKKVVEKAPSKPTKPVSQVKKMRSSADPSKKHIVIAGNYTHLENAKSFAKQLERQGYNEAEIVNFDFTQYHTVIAGRFDDLREARRISKKLQDQFKIEAYVRVGKS